jgi:hypothetical protein
MDLVDEMVSLTAKDPSPEIFRRWAAISLVSGALSRKTYARLLPSEDTYPNLFILLVGSPASGKSVAIKIADRIASDAENVVGDLFPNRMTMRQASSFLSTKMEKSDRVLIHTMCKDIGVQSKGVGFFSEFYNFIDPHDIKMMQLMAHWWDCPPKDIYQTEHSGDDYIYNVYVSFLAGVQPSYFVKIPTDIWTLGMPSRLLLIYSSKEFKVRYRVNPRPPNYEARFKEIVRLVEKIATLPSGEESGEFRWLVEEELNEWVDEEEEKTAPTNPALKEFNDRRTHHLIKLAMVSGASMHQTLLVDKPAFDRAKEWLYEAEEFMPKAVEHVGASPFYQIEAAAVERVRKEYERRGKKAVSEAFLRRHLGRNVQPPMVDRIIEGLIGQDRLRVRAVGKQKEPNKAPRRNFVPNDD